MSTSAPPVDGRVELAGIRFDPLTEDAVVAGIRAALAGGRGGTVVTPNVDILRQALRDPLARGHVESASYVVADGAPLVWASRLRGTALPERVAGSSLIWSLSAALARDGRSVYLLGGPPGTADAAGRALADRYPGLRVAGTHCPPYGFLDEPGTLAAVRAEVRRAEPDVVFVGLGFPRQERLIALLAADLPGAWFVGCGAAIGFAAGDHRRAPRWMRRAGLEWAHRLCAEPRRLARRYLLHDLPFAAGLLTRAALRR